MGTTRMGTKEEVEDQLPGLRFSVDRYSTRSNSLGRLYGNVTLTCEITDKDLWERAIAELDGYKIFSSTTEELFKALGDALDSADGQLAQALSREKALQEELEAERKESERLRGVLARLESELGLG